MDTIENGSTWYTCGHHWRVVEQAERDGEPAVTVVCLTGKKKKGATFTWITRLFLRRAVRSEEA